MLGGARIAAIVPVSNLDRAIEFYGRTLGFGTAERDPYPGTPGATFTTGGGQLYVYESVGAGQSRHTIAAFEVDDIEECVSRMRGSGIAPEEYDSPGLKTENGIATIGEDRGAWFKDPDGNILGITQRARVGAAV